MTVTFSRRFADNQASNADSQRCFLRDLRDVPWSTTGRCRTSNPQVAGLNPAGRTAGIAEKDGAHVGQPS